MTPCNKKIMNALQAHKISGNGICREPLKGTFHDRWSMGMATVEASIVMTLFLFAMFAFMQMVLVLMVQVRVYKGCLEGIREAASKVYVMELTEDEADVESRSHDETAELSKGNILTDAGIYALVYTSIQQELKEDALINQYVKGGSAGVLIQKAKLNDEGFIEVTVGYGISLKVPVFKLPTLKLEERIWQKAYLGCTLNGTEDTYVYVTDYQSVYHTTRGCSHLNIHVAEVSKEVLETQYPRLSACQICGSGTRFYVTEDGDCYHSTLACAGLKRTIYRVKKGAVSHLKACSSCG